MPTPLVNALAYIHIINHKQFPTKYPAQEWPKDQNLMKAVENTNYFDTANHYEYISKCFEELYDYYTNQEKE